MRVHLKKGLGKLNEDCDIMIGQIRVIENKRLLKRIGELNQDQIRFIKANLTIILDWWQMLFAYASCCAGAGPQKQETLLFVCLLWKIILNETKNYLIFYYAFIF